jgi:hypothetical protein
MAKQMSEQELYREAKERVEAKKGFYIHFTIFALVSIMLYIIWRVTWTGYPWYIWPIFGWGIGIAAHFLAVFVFPTQSSWEKRAIEREVERLRRERQ